MDEAKILEINSIEEHDRLFGATTRNPMMSVIDMSKLAYIEHTPKRFGIHVVVCYIDAYEYQHDDNIVSTLGFYSPGQYGRFNSGRTDNPKGWALAIDIKLSSDTTLTNRIKELSFFNSQSSRVIHLNKDETSMIINYMCSLDKELNTPQDVYTEPILRSGLSVLMNICQRYYDNHNNIGNEHHKDIIARMNGILDNYLKSPSAGKEVPTVASIAKVLGLTPNYLGDLVRKHTEHSAHDYICHYILREARYQLQYSNSSISEISYNMGYKYPHHFTRVFKNTYDITPSEYRAKYRQQKVQKSTSEQTL